MKKIISITSLIAVVLVSLTSGQPVRAQVYYGGYNVPPVWESKSTFSVAQGDTLTFTVKANDGNEDPVTYEAVRFPSGAAFNPASRIVTFTPNYNQLGTFPLVLSATDGKSAPVLKTFYAAVYSSFSGIQGGTADSFGFYSPNNAPRFDRTSSYYTVNPNERVEFQLRATDPDSDSISFRSGDLPASSSFDQRSGFFSWVPVESARGVYTMDFYALDSMGNASAPLTVTIVVGGGSMSRVIMAPYGTSATVQTVGTYNVYGSNVYGTYYPATSVQSREVRFASTPNTTVRPNQSFVYDASVAGNVGYPVRYRLTYGPEGAFVNESTGRVSWVVPANSYTSQKFDFTVTAETSNGMSATQSFTLTTVDGAPATRYVYRSAPATTVVRATEAPKVVYQQAVSQAMPVYAASYPTSYAAVSTVGQYYPSAPVIIQTGRVVPTAPMLSSSADYSAYTGSIYNVSASNALRSFNIAVRPGGEGEMVVTWDSSKPSTAEIVYGYQSHARTDEWNTILNYDFTTGVSNQKVTRHQMSLGRLQVGKTYHLRVISRTDTETDISREIVFIPLQYRDNSYGVNQSYGAAQVVGTTGSFLTSNAFLTVAGLGALALVLYALYIAFAGRRGSSAHHNNSGPSNHDWNEALASISQYHTNGNGHSAGNGNGHASHSNGQVNGNGNGHSNGNGQDHSNGNAHH